MKNATLISADDPACHLIFFVIFDANGSKEIALHSAKFVRRVRAQNYEIVPMPTRRDVASFGNVTAKMPPYVRGMYKFSLAFPTQLPAPIVSSKFMVPAYYACLLRRAGERINHRVAVMQLHLPNATVNFIILQHWYVGFNFLTTRSVRARFF